MRIDPTSVINISVLLDGFAYP